jgi:hypothetical protein
MLQKLNPDFAKALAKGERWALQTAGQVDAIDRPTRRHPERAKDEGGKPHHHCSKCPFPEGCVVWDLD